MLLRWSRQVVILRRCFCIPEVLPTYRQVVLVQGCISVTEVVLESACSGLCRQVVLVQECISVTEVVLQSACSGLCRQVVLVQECISITEVVLQSACSGLCRQVYAPYPDIAPITGHVLCMFVYRYSREGIHNLPRENAFGSPQWRRSMFSKV